MKIEPRAIQSMVEAMGNDIRQAFNVVQMWCTKAAGSGEAGRGVGTNTAVNAMISKDASLRLSEFDALHVMFRCVRSILLFAHYSFVCSLFFCLLTILVQHEEFVQGKVRRVLCRLHQGPSPRSAALREFDQQVCEGRRGAAGACFCVLRRRAARAALALPPLTSLPPLVRSLSNVNSRSPPAG